VGIALIVLIALVPVAGIAGAAASSRGLTGQISHAWSTLTSASSNVGNNAERLGQLGNSRGLYWREGLKVGEHSLLAGVGAGGFDTARTRYTTNTSQFAHAHSYLIETFADLGLIGIAVSLALLAAWVAACRRTLAGAPGSDRHSAERTGLLTLLAVVVTFGVSSLIDWTWFVPGVAVPALVAAGWLAGRGPLAAAGRGAAGRGAAGLGAAGCGAAGPGPLAAAGRGAAAGGAFEAAERNGSATRRVGGFTSSPARAAGAFAAVVVAVIAAWFVWQPLHSANSFGAAISAMSRGDAPAALADARAAADSDPLSVDPLLEESFIYGALRDQAAARSELVKATSVQPENPQTWSYLGAFDLQAHQPRLALAELETAHRLDLTSAAISTQLGQARTEALSATPGQTGPA
jgi:O-Antigen ligase